MMNRLRYIYVALALLAGLAIGNAQTRIWNFEVDGQGKKSHNTKTYHTGLHTSVFDGVHHLAGVHVDGGYSMLVQNAPGLSQTPGGYTLGLGVDYCYQNGKLIVQTGLNLRWQSVRDSVESAYMTRRLTDKWQTPFLMRYDFTNRCDYARNLTMEIPLMVGGYIFDRVYLLVGPKFALQLYGNTEVRNLTSSTATYDRYIGTMGEMDNHGIRKDVPLTVRHEALPMRFDVMASAELGYEWSLGLVKAGRGYRRYVERDHRLRVAAFADFGLLNLGPHMSEQAYWVPDATPYDFVTFDFHHMLTTAEAKSASLHNFFAGVRVSYFFYGYKTKEKCLMCGARGAKSRWR